MGEFIWNVDVEVLLERKPLVDVVTEDGVYRRGTLTAITTAPLRFLGRQVPVPVELELNGDPELRLPLTRVRSVTEVTLDD